MRDSTARVISAGIGIAVHSVHVSDAAGPWALSEDALFIDTWLPPRLDADDAPRADAQAAVTVRISSDTSTRHFAGFIAGRIRAPPEKLLEEDITREEETNERSSTLHADDVRGGLGAK